jgi:predicted lipid-binding transport protein (Tim44 family)
MMDMGDMVDRCMNAMGSMMGGGIMGNSLLLLVLLLVLLFIWVVGLGTVGAVIFWAIRRFTETRPSGG